MVELRSGRSFYKRDHEIFRTFLQSKNIEHRSKHMMNRAAMTRSSNRLRRFPPHGPFARSKKHDFPNIYNGDLLSNAFD